MIQHLTKFKKLESLTLYRCKDVTDVSLSTIVENFPLLNSLDIFGCQVLFLMLTRPLPAYNHLGDAAVAIERLVQALRPEDW